MKGNLGNNILQPLHHISDRPAAPGKARVVMSLGRSATLGWDEPEDDGGCKIGTYIVEYYRVNSIAENILTSGAHY